MPSYDSDPSPLWKPVAFGLLVVVVGMVAYGMGRQSSSAPPSPPVTPEAARSAERVVPELAAEVARLTEPLPVPTIPFEVPAIERENRAVEQPALPPAPTEPPAAAFALPPVEEKPREDPGTCLSLEARPNRVEVYGASGAAVQLIVRARNRCAREFFGRDTYFRAYATAPGGFDMARATGRFQGSIPAWGSAETLIALECDPTRVAQYRVELWR